MHLMSSKQNDTPSRPQKTDSSTAFSATHFGPTHTHTHAHTQKLGPAPTLLQQQADFCIVLGAFQHITHTHGCPARPSNGSWCVATTTTTTTTTTTMQSLQLHLRISCAIS